MKRRVLYVGAFVPDENGNHAGARAAWNNLEFLRRGGADVDIIVCTTERKAAIGESAQTVPQRASSFIAGVLACWRYFSLEDVLVANVLHARVNRPFIAAMCQALATDRYDEIFVDFTQVIKAALIARRMSEKNIRITCCLHDIYTQKFLRKLGLYPRLIQGVLTQAELALLRQMDEIRLLNTKDESIVRNFYALKQTAVAEFAAPPWTQRVSRVEGRTDVPKLICYGNFNRNENAESVLLLVRDVLPAVRRAFPSCLLQLLGSGSIELHRKHRLSDHVVALGFVEDPSSAFGECACVVAPLTMGAGVKFKVLDALAAKVPVIGTAIAFEGIEPHELMVEASIAEFPSVLIRFLGKLRERADLSVES